MQRVSTSTVPTSSIAATATMVDGFTTAQSDHKGCSWSFTRQFLSTGILSTQTDPRGITTSTQTDIASRPIIQSDGEGSQTTTSYTSCCDQPASITDALGNVINYSYDIRNRQVAEYGTGIQPATYGHDDANRMTSLTTYRAGESTITTDPTARTDGDTTAYVYHDATGLLLSETKADGTVETRSYDNHNRLSTITSARGNVTTHSYNILTGELLTVSYSDSTPEKTYVYNHLGQVTSITDASSTHTFTYNEYSESLNSSQQVNTTNFAVIEQYDELGRSAGYLHKRATGDMQVNTTGYDSKGRIGTASFKQSSEVKEFTYTYLEGTSLLSSLASPNGMARELNYEAQRNLITEINDMRAASGVSLREYSYDAIARPATIPEEVSSGALVSNRSAICLQIACIDLTRSTLNGHYYLIWDPSEPTATRSLALQRYGSWFTFSLDISKNVKDLFNPSSSVVTTYDYSPFGAVSRSGSTKSPVQWSSEIHDDELALTYYNYRHYNPSDGRWINRDPIGIEGGLNLYGFVGNTPNAYIDIKGDWAALARAIPILWKVGRKLLKKSAKPKPRPKSSTPPKTPSPKSTNKNKKKRKGGDCTSGTHWRLQEVVDQLCKHSGKLACKKYV